MTGLVSLSLSFILSLFETFTNLLLLEAITKKKLAVKIFNLNSIFNLLEKSIIIVAIRSEKIN